MEKPTLDQIRKLSNAFFGYNQQRIVEARAAGGRFAYYTTAATALKILRKREIWLRNAAVMNDFSEIDHGFACLRTAYGGPLGIRLRDTLDTLFLGISTNIEQTFNDLWPRIQGDTFLTCVSEHRASEDLSGRLSLWRAYGGRSGVAIVFNGTAMFGESGALGATSSAVLYADPAAFSTEFGKSADQIQKVAADLAPLERELVQNAVFQMFRFAVICTKHPGFQEEREWRVVASPTLHGLGKLTQAVEVVNGIPQVVLKLAFANAPDEGLVGLEPTELIDRVLIGPCEFPWAMHRAFGEALGQLGFSDPYSRVVVSDIPLRHSSNSSLGA